MPRVSAKLGFWKEIQRAWGHASSATTDIYLQQLCRAQNPYAEELVRRFGFDAV